MAEHTLPGKTLPTGMLPPTLLFHRWQQYDDFIKLERKDTASDFLTEVAKTAQKANVDHYRAWYKRFADACKGLRASEPLEVTTLWRLAVGWGTNPALEVGITLDHFLGFPYIPGSAVKGLLHRVAEQELLETSERGEPPIPLPPTGEIPASPPDDLLSALRRARLVRALFGSLHLEKGSKDDPEAPMDRLKAWARALGETHALSWTDAKKSLAVLLSDAATGGMVSCLDAVPCLRVFSREESRQLLTLDVLTPHKDNKPIPVHFLAVRDGAAFELRYRLASWSANKPRDELKDEAEGERAAALEGVSRKEIETQIERWLTRAVTELGAGGKTTAGYGYFQAPGRNLADVRLLDPPPVPPPEDPRSEAERYAAKMLPEGVDEATVINKLDAALDGALEATDPAEREKHEAVVRLFIERFPTKIEKMRNSPAPAKRNRIQKLNQVLGENAR